MALTPLRTLHGTLIVLFCAGAPCAAQDPPGFREGAAGGCADEVLLEEFAAFSLPELAPTLGASAQQDAAIRRLAIEGLPAIVLVEDEIASLHEALHEFAAHVVAGEVAELLEDLRTHERERETLVRDLAQSMFDVLTPEQRLRWEALVSSDPDGPWITAMDTQPCASAR